MKKIKYLLFGMMAVVACAVVVASCSDDDDDVDASSNYDRYQQAVNATIQSTQKASGNKKAILLVAFGSTWQQAFDAFDETVEAYQSAYPKYDIYLSFSSAICINRSAAGENTTARNFYAPSYWLTGFATVEYTDIIVQSLQVIPGEEYSRVISAVKDFANNSNGDIDDDYLAGVNLYIGYPLMASADDDVDNLAAALDGYYSSYAAKGVVAFMGHGNPDSYDIYGANVRYTQLETALQELSPNYFVGTVDMADNYKNDVYSRMLSAGITSGSVYLHPLMSIAGDHAHNDLAGDTDEPDDLTENDEEISWKTFFATAGYTCNDETVLQYGLLELPKVRQLWINHTSDAISRGPEDLYHSMNPEE